MELDDPMLEGVISKLLACSLSENTTKAYGYRFKHFVDFCKRANESSLLTGDFPSEDEKVLMGFCAYEFEFHGNKYATIKGKLFAIRWHTMEAGYPDPLKHKVKLQRLLSGMRRLRGGKEPKEPMSVNLLTTLYAHLIQGGIRSQAVAVGVVVAFFFLLRISEYAAQDSHAMAKYILRRQDVSFRRNGRVCTWDQRPDEVEIVVRGSKTDQVGDGVVRNQFMVSHDGVCPVRALVLWFKVTDDAGLPASAPLFSVPGKEGWTVITRQQVSEAIKAAGAAVGIKRSALGTHSARIGGATALLHAKVPQEVVRIFGRWRSMCFVDYERLRRQYMPGLSSKMGAATFDVDPRREERQVVR